MEKLIIQIIRAITENHIKQNIHPTYALRSEVFRELQSKEPGLTLESYQIVINRMVKNGKLKFGRTVNDIYLMIKDTTK